MPATACLYDLEGKSAYKAVIDSAPVTQGMRYELEMRPAQILAQGLHPFPERRGAGLEKPEVSWTT